MKRQARLLALLPAAAAGALLLLEVNPILDLVYNTDPTLQGTVSVLNLRPLFSVAGHLATILLSLYLLFTSAPLPGSARMGAWLCFGAVGVEVLALAPCLLAADALCGVFYLLINQAAAPAMLAGVIVVLLGVGSRVLAGVSIVIATALIAAAAGVYWQVTPKSASDCANVTDSLKRDNCLMNFALRDSDEKLCDEVNFDSSRWSCLYQIAERKGLPALCERIALPCRHTAPGPACEPDLYRDTCYVVVARKLKDSAWCDRVGDAGKRGNCKAQSQ